MADTKPTVRCSLCEKPAKVANGVVVRSCIHADVPVVADMKATAVGDSAVRK